jgi:hypothetical protein
MACSYHRAKNNAKIFDKYHFCYCSSRHTLEKREFDDYEGIEEDVDGDK